MADGPAATPMSMIPLTNDPARTGYDPSLQRWMNHFNALTGKMTSEGKHHFREDMSRKNEARDVARCEADRDWLFAYSPVVRFLREGITALGGELDAANVVCRRCPALVLGREEDGSLRVRRQAGGFSPAHGIMICANEIRDRGHLEDTLAHEMVHAWDHLRWKVDWSGEKSLKHSACAEVSPPSAGTAVLLGRRD